MRVYASVDPQTGKQRRIAVRYKLQLPVIFHWNDDGEHTEGGFTSDVALCGARIRSSKCPPVGSDIRIEVLLPSPGHSNEVMRIQCIGKVAHIEYEGEMVSFGVEGDFDDDQLTWRSRT